MGNYQENALVLWDCTTYEIHTVAKVGFSVKMNYCYLVGGFDTNWDGDHGGGSGRAIPT